jgi:hypothetical protein
MPQVRMEPQESGADIREPLSGLVERVTFHNSDNGFCVLRVKVRGHRDLVTVNVECWGATEQKTHLRTQADPVVSPPTGF